MDHRTFEPPERFEKQSTEQTFFSSHLNQRGQTSVAARGSAPRLTSGRMEREGYIDRLIALS